MILMINILSMKIIVYIKSLTSIEKIQYFDLLLKSVSLLGVCLPLSSSYFCILPREGRHIHFAIAQAMS